jgi:Uma2 family endonuclease
MVLANPHNKAWTYEDLIDLPDDGKHYEIVAGEIVELPSPSDIHQLIAGLLVTMLTRFVRGREIGWVFPAPFDVRFSPYFVLQPDIVFYRFDGSSRAALASFDRANARPDIVVEVISPSSQGHDRVRKLSTYATFGVSEYWIVDPEKDELQVLVLRNGTYVPFEQLEDGIIRSEVLAGLEIDPKKDLFS